MFKLYDELLSMKLLSYYILLINIHINHYKCFKVVEGRKQIEIEEQEIKRKEKELIATVKLPAEAEAYKVQTLAEGMRLVN